ncbi:hypothetical protein X731_19935 [Mesorhizobium sp. L2C054A000]|nr:hypothetical protein X731_19935 [Mesorhizobium sp. L2C054A000]
MQALPLIALPGISPRIVTGERADRSLGALLAALVIGGIVDNSDPSPRHYTGEDAGRQVRGSANAPENKQLMPEPFALHFVHPLAVRRNFEQSVPARGRG